MLVADRTPDESRSELKSTALHLVVSQHFLFCFVICCLVMSFHAQLESAALRELKEETGLTLSEEELATSRVICLWEVGLFAIHMHFCCYFYMKRKQ